MAPQIQFWELITEGLLCGSVVKDGAEIGGLEKDNDFEWI